MRFESTCRLALAALTGLTLTAGALGPNATRTDPTAILNFINANKNTQYDLDGNGSFDPLTDGLMLLRYMLNLSGSAVVNGQTFGLPIDTGTRVLYYNKKMFADAKLDHGTQNGGGFSVSVSFPEIWKKRDRGERIICQGSGPHR